MKTILKSVMALVITLLWACDKHVEISDVFSFEVGENRGIDPDIINNPVELNFTLEEQSDDNAGYTMSFVSSGEGTFTYKNRTYKAGDAIPLGTDLKEFSGYYTGTTSGAHEIVFTIVSSTTIARNYKVTIPYINDDFEADIFYPALNHTGEIPNIAINLKDENPLEYTLSYTISPNDGSVLVQEGSVVAQNSPLNSGITTLDFEFATVGEYSINLVITNHLGVQKIKTADITVEHTPFTFIVDAPREIPLDQVTHFKFTLEGHDNLTYKLTRGVSGGLGTFYFGNNLIVDQGTWTGAFKTRDTSDQTFAFTITDNFGNSKRIEKRIKITPWYE